MSCAVPATCVRVSSACLCIWCHRYSLCHMQRDLKPLKWWLGLTVRCFAHPTPQSRPSSLLPRLVLICCCAGSWLTAGLTFFATCKGTLWGSASPYILSTHQPAMMTSANHSNSAPKMLPGIDPLHIINKTLEWWSLTRITVWIIAVFAYLLNWL